MNLEVPKNSYSIIQKQKIVTPRAQSFKTYKNGIIYMNGG